MITSKLMLCAEGILRDATTNTISVYNILEDISALGFPLFIQRCFSLNLLERTTSDPSKLDCVLRIKNNDLEIFTFPVKVDFQDKMKNRTIITLNGFVVPNPGILSFKFFYEGKEIDSYDVTVNLIKEPDVKTS